MSRGPTRREWWVVLLVTLLATAVMQLPYILGYALARPGTEYTGNLVNVEDFSYQAIILQGYQGAWQYHGQFTPEQHAPAFLYVFYLALGHLARFLGLSVVGVWHVSRVMASLLLIPVTFGFVSSFLQDRAQRWVAFLLAVFGSGFDWALFPWEKFDIVGGAPVDFRMPEAHLFFSALTYPHFAVGIVLLLLTFWFSLKALERRDPRYAMGAGIANVLLVLIYPFLIVLVAAVLGAYWLLLTWRSHHLAVREVVLLAIAFGMPVPLLAYYAYILQVNPVYRAWNEQVVTLSPNPLHYALAYGLMIVLGLLGWRSRRVTHPSDEEMTEGSRAQLDLLFVWIVVVLILLYAPLNMQRRFVEGLQVPLAIVGAVGLVQVVLPWAQQTHVFQWLARKRRYTLDGFARVTIVMFLLLMSAANVVVVLQLSLLTAFVQPDAFFRSAAEIKAVDWLRDHAAQDEVTIAAYWTGAMIPARAGSAVFVGQRYETVHFEDKFGMVTQFYGSQASDEWRCNLLRTYGVKYVWWGPRERSLGAFDPGTVPYLEMAFSDSDVALYRFVDSSRSVHDSPSLSRLLGRIPSFAEQR